MKTFNDCCIEVAKKHKVGNNLVMGHRRIYYEEAAEMYADQFRFICKSVPDHNIVSYEIYQSNENIQK